MISPKDVEARKGARDASKAEFTAKGVQVSALQVTMSAQLHALLLPHPTQVPAIEGEVCAWQVNMSAQLDAPLLSCPI